MFSHIKAKNVAVSLLGSAILAFGLYNIHSFSGVTEGGVLGLTLLLHHWFGISPAASGLVLNLCCYYLGWRVIGGSFVAYSLISGGGFSLFYAVFERFPPLFPVSRSCRFWPASWARPLWAWAWDSACAWAAPPAGMTPWP